MLADFLGGWEIVLILACLLILFGARNLPEFIRGFDQALDEFKKDAHSPAQDEPQAMDRAESRKDARDSLALWIAQGFDVGRIPLAPGTFGSLVGILWFLILLAPGSFVLFVFGAFLGVALSIWLCGQAEKILRETDPGSVVLDEIVVLPICFLPWVTRHCWQQNAMPGPEVFLSAETWHLTGLIFVLFRVFDVWKPWPVRQSQSLPGGMGVTADDFLAAGYTALASLFFIP